MGKQRYRLELNLKVLELDRDNTNFYNNEIRNILLAEIDRVKQLSALDWVSYGIKSGLSCNISDYKHHIDCINNIVNGHI